MVIWLLVLLLAIGGWAVGFRLAYLHRSDSEWANYASIAGLGLAIGSLAISLTAVRARLNATSLEAPHGPVN
jgi:hypothetical protein